MTSSLRLLNEFASNLGFTVFDALCRGNSFKGMLEELSHGASHREPGRPQDDQTAQFSLSTSITVKAIVRPPRFNPPRIVSILPTLGPNQRFPSDRNAEQSRERFDADGGAGIVARLTRGAAMAALG